MKTLLVAMALACGFHVVVNSARLARHGPLSLAAAFDDVDDKAQDDKELDKALQEILYQEDDQDLQERAGAPNADATKQCTLALPNVTSAVGYTNSKHPCVAFCKYRYTSTAHGRVRQLHGGTYIQMNNLVTCGGHDNEYVCGGKKCVLPAANDNLTEICTTLIPQPTGSVEAFIAGPCKLLCADTAVFNIHNKTATVYTTLPDGTSCSHHGQAGACSGGHCMLTQV